MQVSKLKETKGDHLEHASMTRKGNITQVEETQRGVLQFGPGLLHQMDNNLFGDGLGLIGTGRASKYATDREATAVVYLKIN